MLLINKGVSPLVRIPAVTKLVVNGLFSALLHSHPVKGKFINHETSNEQNAVHTSNLIFNKIVTNLFDFKLVGNLRKVFKFKENASKGYFLCAQFKSYSPLLLPLRFITVFNTGSPSRLKMFKKL